MEWINHGERPIYESSWVSVGLIDVEVPGHRRFDHHVVHSGDAVGTIAINDEGAVLVMWRHRVITDTWGWEIPAGRIEPGESGAEAARRETREETGWAPATVDRLVEFFPCNGLSDLQFEIFVSTDAVYEGPPTDVSEAARVEWLPVGQLREEIAAGRMRDGLSLAACCYALALHPSFGS